MSNTYCVLADVGLSVHNGGHTSMCNGSRQIFHSHSGDAITLDKYSLSDAWNSPTRQEIKTALESGVRHANCTDCWSSESAGLPSMRQIHNKNLANVIPIKEQPRAVVLKPGNVCNLACRHCDPAVSSGWYDDYYSAEVKDKSYPDWVQQFKIVRDSYAVDNQAVWGVLESWLPNLVYYDLYGAEPLLLKPVLNLLTTAAEKKYAANQCIHINTNGTIWRDEFIDIFKQFKSVDLDISVDGINEQFDYMRYPAHWSNVLENILKYKALSVAHSNIKVGITITVSIYNILYINDIINYFQDLGISAGINVLHTPEFLNIKNLPKEVKSEISNYKLLPLSVISYMNLDNYDLIKDFFDYTNRYDQTRNQQFQKTFPKIYNLLKSYE